MPLLMAEADRDVYRREQAALAREKEIMKDVPGWEVSTCFLRRSGSGLLVAEPLPLRSRADPPASHGCSRPRRLARRPTTPNATPPAPSSSSKTLIACEFGGGLRKMGLVGASVAVCAGVAEYGGGRKGRLPLYTVLLLSLDWCV